MAEIRDDGLADDLRPVRSALFVPANREPWIEKSPAYGADVVVLDLEDATPPAEKQAAQAIVQRAIPVLRERGQGVWVRINEIDGPFVADDLEAIVWPGLEAVCLPKVTGPEAVRELDSMLTDAEGRHGVPSGAIRIVPLLETAPAILGAADVFRSSSRVAYGGGIVAPSGDVALAIGFRWSDTFEETLVLRSQVLIAARACGIENPITGLVTSVDPEPVRRFVEQSRALGYAGMFVIHPSHVAHRQRGVPSLGTGAHLVRRDPRGCRDSRARGPRDVRRLAGTNDRRGNAARRPRPPRAGSRVPSAGDPTAMTPDQPAPLSDLRVLDLGHVVAGPFAGTLLGDLGADVIKIEDPKRGDTHPHAEPPARRHPALVEGCGPQQALGRARSP